MNILTQLFFAFIQVGMFSVGGGYAAIPLIQNQIVDIHGLMTLAEFTDLITIAEMTPGPISINSATFVGMRLAGIPGVLLCTGLHHPLLLHLPGSGPLLLQVPQLQRRADRSVRPAPRGGRPYRLRRTVHPAAGCVPVRPGPRGSLQFPLDRGRDLCGRPVYPAIF